MAGKPKTFFKRLSPQREKRTFLIGAMDSETIGLDGELALVTAHHEQWDAPGVYDDMEQFLEHVFSINKTILRKTIWYSHNAEYDWRYLVGAFRAYADRYTFRPIERMKGKFFEIGVYSKTDLTPQGNPRLVTRFRDSYAVYNQSLKEFTKNFAPKHMKQDIGLAWQTFDKTNPKHVEYAKNDVVGLVVAIDNFDRTLWETFGVHLRGTFASTAYQAVLRKLPEDEYHNRVSPDAETFFRTAYYGGRVQLNARADRTHENVTVFDINSSYPANMRHGVPKGKPTYTKKYRSEFPGFYKTIARVPSTLLLPFVPHRSSARGELSFPTGEFVTWLSSIEMEYATSLGCSFEVIEGYVFEMGLTHCFNEFIDTCEELRAKFKGTATEIVVKFVQNSSYGKWATKVEGREIRISFGEMPDGFLPVVDEDTGDIVPDCWFQDTTRDAEYMMPHYAAWITANARITLDRGMRAAGAHNVLYADTDSLHVLDDGARRIMATAETDAPLVGKRYGQYKLEKTFSEVRYHAPKSYTFMIVGKNHLEAVYKGIPANLLKMPPDDHPNFAAEMARRTSLVESLHAGECVTVEFHSSASMQSYLKSGKRYSIRKRRNTLADNIYSHKVVDGRFVPIAIHDDLSAFEPKPPPKFTIIRTLTKGATHAGILQ